MTDTKPKKIARDAYVYFDTEEKDYAPQDAQNLMKRLKIKLPRTAARLE